MEGDSPSQEPGSVQLLQHLLKGDGVEAKENSYRALGVNATALPPASAAMETGEESSEESSSEGRARTVSNVVCKSLNIRRSRAAAE